MSDVKVAVIFKSLRAIVGHPEVCGPDRGIGICRWLLDRGGLSLVPLLRPEARGCFTTLAAVAMATKNSIGLGITSPYMRHPPSRHPRRRVLTSCPTAAFRWVSAWARWALSTSSTIST